ncbi:MAG: hypothetical protein H0W02_12905 [Ktedonobacteraceae bacterium]|nr:hypothetical protein [Ktedonobacteraceae bacterium]
MLTQTFKQWLRKMFAWWPWKQPAETSYAEATISSRQEEMPGLPLRFTNDGLAPQSGSAPRRFTAEQWPGSLVQPPASPIPGESSEPRPPLLPPRVEMSTEPTRGPITAPSDTMQPTPATPEQHLDFLRYLVQRGIVNEGFEQGRVPQQYRKNS